LRGLLGCGSFGLFIMALPLQPLVNTFAVAASAPLIITVLSVPEKRNRGLGTQPSGHVCKP